MLFDIFVSSGLVGLSAVLGALLLVSSWARHIRRKVDDN